MQHNTQVVRHCCKPLPDEGTPGSDRLQGERRALMRHQRNISGQRAILNLGEDTMNSEHYTIQHSLRLTSSPVLSGGNIMAELIKVSAQSRTTAVAGAIAGIMREQGYAEIQAIGAAAINQAIKAVTIARGYVRDDSFDLMLAPYFTEVEIEGAERTAIRMVIHKYPIQANGIAH
jgi:stage V sporulation protein S